MPNLPKIVRERLKLQSRAVVDHPDPDLLTAYSERSLPQLERDIVLEHLARCNQCREIVALALPPTEAVQDLGKAPSPQLLSWPAFRWGFASAGLAAIVLFGLLEYQHHTHMTTMSARETSSPVMKAKVESLPAVALDQDKAAQKKSDSSASVNPENAKKGMVPVPSRSAARVLARAAPAHGPLQSNQWQQQNYVNQANTPPAAAPPANEKQAGAGVPAESQPVQVQVQSQAVDTQAQDLNTLALNKNAITQLPSQNRQTAETEVERAKPAVNGAAAGLAQSNQPQLRSLKSVAVISPRWTINSAGGLQRSFDQGATWQDVDVNNAPVGANAALELSAAPARAQDDSLKMAKRKSAAPLVFRTVAAIDSDVWAGGASGLLYHSSDSGQHWTRITPASADAVLSGDILTMDFTDVHHGKIVTSTGETWTTADNGQSWQKQ